MDSPTPCLASKHAFSLTTIESKLAPASPYLIGITSEMGVFLTLWMNRAGFRSDPLLANIDAPRASLTCTRKRRDNFINHDADSGGMPQVGVGHQPHAIRFRSSVLRPQPD